MKIPERMIRCILLMLFLMAFGACDQDEPLPDFSLSFSSSVSELIEGGGFDRLANDKDAVAINIQHSGELDREIPIALEVSGSAVAGEDFSSLPDTIYYNPFDDLTERSFSFKAIDDLEYEGGIEQIELKFSYDMNGTMLSESVELDVHDNDFRFEITWNNESGVNADTDLDLIVIRGHNSVLYEAGRSQSESANTKSVDLSGSFRKWQYNAGYGCGVLYQDSKNSAGNVSYITRFYLPDGKFIEYPGSFGEDDYLSNDTNSHLPMVVLRAFDSGFTLRFIYESGQEDLVEIL